MRTNIVLDDHLVQEAQRLTNAPSKRALVHEALATLIRVRRDEKARESYAERLGRLRLQIDQIDLGEGSHEIVRAARDSR